MFSEQDIRKNVNREITFEKGRRLFLKDDVLDVDVEEYEADEEFYINGTVRGSYGNEYNVWIRVNQGTGEIEEYSCDCEAYFNYSGMCKHCVALALEYLEQLKNGTQISLFNGIVAMKQRKACTDAQILNMIEFFALRRRMKEQTANGNIEIVPELKERYVYSYYSQNERRYALSFKIGPEDGRKYVLKNISEFIDRIRKEEMFSYGKQLAFVHSKSVFTKKAWKYVGIMEAAAARIQAYEGLGKEMLLTPDLWEDFYEMNKGECVEFVSNTSKVKTIRFMESEPPVKVSLRKSENEGYQVKIPPLEMISGVNRDYVRLKNAVYPCSESMTYALGCFLEMADEKEEISYHIAEQDMPAFCGAVLPELESIHGVDRGELDLEEYQPKEAELAYYLDEENGQITLKTMGSYGENTYNLLNPPRLGEEYHDRAKELRALNLSRSYFPNEDSRNKYLYFDSEDQEKMYRLLSTGIRQFEESGVVYATDKIKGKRLIQAPKTQVGVALKSGLLELSVQSDSFSPEELSEILDNYRKKKKYYRMRSGDYMQLEENGLATVAELLDGLGISNKEIESGIIDLPKFRAGYVDQMLREKSEELRIERSAEYKAIIRDMKNIEDSDYTIPATLKGTLRDYQKLGFRWLNTLAKLGFGGILADDMGLGKTLQMIAYLLYRRENGMAKNPCLVICPASLVYNWEYEVRHFAPELKVKVIAGNAQQRESLIKEENESDVWITSYDLIKRDIQSYREWHFDTEVIDEAQNIKNQGTQAAKAVKKVSADIRFALTGTPIENRLSELWSIFDYLMPGILGTYEKFRKGYELPIVQNQDSRMAGRLNKMISPFILRRVKKDVLKELPDKIEQVVYTQMETEQRKIYEAHALRLMESLKKQSKEEIQKGKLQILAELTRLRQICCAPEMIYEDYKETACKIDTCMELVNQAIEGKHKVLLFSQFTSVFPILEERLRQEKVAYYELTGQTPKEERMRLVEQFNSDDVPVFLISLKAGGTGLNLTSASIVIHFDPWWNLAAQNQATDRAHRIGQENQVVVFKLIAQNTIEEKIVGLQEKKQQLASQVLEGERVAAAALTKDDFMEILEF